MFQASTPEPNELPTRQALARSTLIALAVATLILVVVVLPAEYGVDPTGIGQVLGLKQMGEIKVALAREAAADAAVQEAAPADADLANAPAAPATEPEAEVAPATSAEAATRTATAQLTLSPNQGDEIKLAMKAGATVRFSWSTEGGGLNFDLHTDRPSGPSHSYKEGRNQETDEGEFTAIADGLHGWFWRNRTNEVVTVTLEVTGDFDDVREPAR